MMYRLYNVKDMLLNEIKEYGTKDKLDLKDVEVVDKLAHAAKNMCKVIEDCENESMGYSNGYSYENPSMRNRRNPNMSMRNMRGGNSRMDGGYSNHGGFNNELQELLQQAPNDYVRQKLQEAMQGMNN
jgi:hypothetical protein